MSVDTTIRYLCAALLCASALTAQTAVNSAPEHDPRALFSLRADISADVAAGDLVRLPLPRPVIEECRSDLSDLRVFAGDRLVPYAVRTMADTFRRTVVPATVLSAQQGAAATGTGEPSVQRESYDLQPPREWTNDGTWRLRVEVDSSRGPFARDVEMGWSSDASATAPQLTSTIFRLRDGRQSVVVDTPRKTGELLRVRIFGQDTARGLAPLEPRFSFERRERVLGEPVPLEFELVLADSSDPSYSHETGLPSGITPAALRFETASTVFRRRVTLAERRVDGTVQTVATGWITGGPGIEPQLELRIPDRPSSGSDSPPQDQTEMLLAIDGGDSPELEGLRVFAVVPQPELVFAWPGSENNPELYVGGGRAASPRFDLQQIAERRLVDRATGELTWALLTDSTMPSASLQQLSDNPLHDTRPLLDSLQRAGGMIDPGAFSWTASVELPPNASGLYRIVLPVDVLRQVRADFADLRFVQATDEAADRQWPYLIEPGGRWTAELEVDSLPAERGLTRLRLAAFEPDTVTRNSALLPDVLELVIDQPFFDRSVQLRADLGGEPVSILERRLRVGVTDRILPASSRTASLRLPLPETVRRGSLSSFELVIDDGDDAPVELLSATIGGAGWQAVLPAPPGSYQAIYSATGAGELTAPRYELHTAANLVRNLRGSEIALSAGEQNLAATSPGLGDWLRRQWQSLFLWGTIGLATIALAWITLRSVGSGTDSAST